MERIETLSQPVNAGVDLEQVVEPVQIEPKFRGQNPKVVRKRFPPDVKKRVLARFKDLVNKDTGWRISFSGENFKKAESGASVSDDLIVAQVEAVVALPELMENARLVETHQRLRTHIVEKRIPAGVDSGGYSSSHRAATRTVPQQSADT